MKRYQILVSSTYYDLITERKVINESIMKAGHIPFGMEQFPAANEEQFSYIKRIIDETDYIILIIANRYGTTDDNGISYTEKEYDYAISKGVPILTFIHSNPKSISEENSEDTKAGKNKLETFRRKVSKNRLVKKLAWKNANELAVEVMTALNNAFNTIERPGWLRGGLTFEKELGIKKIYTFPWERPIRKEISSAKKFYYIVYAGDKFVEEHRVEFITAFENGASISVLVGSKGSDFFREIDLMENIPTTNGLNSLDPKIDSVVNEFKRVKIESKNGRGKIEVRAFNTEFRNSLAMCWDNEGKITACLTIMFGYKRAGECMMIEFEEGKGADDCKAYFDKVWNLHSNHTDILYDSSNNNLRSIPSQKYIGTEAKQKYDEIKHLLPDSSLYKWLPTEWEGEKIEQLDIFDVDYDNNKDNMGTEWENCFKGIKYVYKEDERWFVCGWRISN